MGRSASVFAVWVPTIAVQNKWSEGPRNDSTGAGVTITVYLAAY